MKQNIIIDFKDTYPFGACYYYVSNAVKILVRQKLLASTNSQEENIKLKISLLKKANIDNLIKLQQVQEKTNQIHLFYEYVPILMEPWISNIHSTFIESIKLQLAKIASFLAQNHILIDISLSKLGINEKYQVKYFLGIDFQVSPQKSTYDISVYYMNQILQIFHPYLYGPKNRVQKKSMIDEPSINKGQNILNGVKLNHRQTPSHAIINNPQNDQKGKNAPKKSKIIDLLNKVNNFKKQNGIIVDNQNKLHFNSRQQKKSGARSQEKQVSQHQTSDSNLKLSMPISPKESQQYINYFYHPKHQIQTKKAKLNRSLQCGRASDAELAQNDFNDSRKRIFTLTIMETQKNDEKSLLNKKVETAINSSLVAIKKCKFISQRNQ